MLNSQKVSPWWTYNSHTGFTEGFYSKDYFNNIVNLEVTRIYSSIFYKKTTSSFEILKGILNVLYKEIPNIKSLIYNSNIVAEVL